MTLEQIHRLILDVPDFPKPGIVFKDITPILENAEAFKSLAKLMAELVHPQTTKLVAIESRGFILGAGVAQYLDAGMVIVRKPGKLPRETIEKTFALEYGNDTLHMHKGSLKPGDRVTIIDDVLATGGTARAVEEMCQQVGAQVVGHLFLMEIEFLKGRTKLQSPAKSLISL